MKTSTLYYFCMALGGFLLGSCGFAEELTDRAADSPEGMEKSYVINLDNTQADVAKSAWTSFINQRNSKVARIKGSNVHMAGNVPISGINGNVTVKSLFDQIGTNTEMRLWFVKDMDYMTPQSDPAAYDNIDRFIDDYFLVLQKTQIQIEVDNEKEKLANLEKELNKLRKDNEKLHEAITKAEQTIKESRIKIEQNLQAQDQMNNKILEQKEVVQKTQNKLSEVKVY